MPRNVRSDRWPLAAVTAIGLAVRLVSLLFSKHTLVLGDALFYHVQANVLASGRGFINPLQWEFFHRVVATAEHPPLYPLVLSVVSLVGGRSVLAHQTASCVLGSATVAVVALAGRRIAGPRVGLLAGAVAAFYPNLWLNDTQVMSETVYALTLALFLVAVYRFHDRQSVASAALMGGAVGLAALTRTEALALIVIVAIPVVLVKSELPAGRRAVSAGAAVAAALVVLSPWAVRSLVTFDRPVVLTINADTALAGANCPAAYNGAGTGSWVFTCGAAVKISGDESDQAATLRRHALDYVTAHLGRVPFVLLAREGRTWSVFRPLRDDSEPRGTTAWLRVVSFFAVTPFSVTGVWLLRRRGRLTLPLIGMAVLSAVSAATAYGAMRFRLPCEVALVILTAVAIDAVLPWQEAAVAPAPG